LKTFSQEIESFETLPMIIIILHNSCNGLFGYMALELKTHVENSH